MLCDRWGVGQTSITVRGSEPGDLRECEEIIRDAFWNVYRPGCFEHLIWHKTLSGHPDLRQSLVAIVEGRIAGCLMSTRAHIKGSTSAGTPVIAIGRSGCFWRVMVCLGSHCGSPTRERKTLSSMPLLERCG